MYECKSKPTFLRRLGQRVLLIFINQFPFLHKMDNLVVICKHRNVEYLFKMSLQPILLSRNGMNHCFKLNNDDFEKFNKILKNRANLKISIEKDLRLERLILQRLGTNKRTEMN